MFNKICEIHNKPAVLYHKDALQNIFLQLSSIEQFDDPTIDKEYKQQQSLQQLEWNYDQIIKFLMDFDEKLEQYYQQIQQNQKKLKQQVEHNISQLIQKKNFIKNQSEDFTILQVNQIYKEENVLKSSLSQIKQELNNQLKELEIINKLDQLYKLLNNFQIVVNNDENKQVQNQNIAQFKKQFNYQLLQQPSYKYDELCCAIAFNKDATIMIAGCYKLIKVFRFQEDQLREVEQLSSHFNTVSCLQFMKKSNEFVSASYDSTIIIWGQNQNNQWKCNQILKSHSSLIYCITMNQNEDMIISGSSDNTIKFWQKQSNIWSYYYSIDCQSQVRAISLCEDKLIASLDNKKIFFIQLQNQQWMIKQKLSIDSKGFRLSFIDQNQFLFQPFDRQYLLVFDFDVKDQTFKQGQELQYSNKEVNGCYFYFPIRYISSIGLILVKNDRDIHLIKKSQNGQFTVEQSINFSKNCLFGNVTDDGSYIATWDYESKEIQIRKDEF